MAGIAAGLLTIKPQLGILLPAAYLAVGAWRAIAVAMITAILVHMPSFLVFGIEGWREFLVAVGRLNAEIAGPGQLTPPHGMTTIFGQLKMLGVDGVAAIKIQYAITALMTALIAIVWRRPGDALAKASALVTAALLAAPYAYGYEMTALLIAVVFIARAGMTYKSPFALLVLMGWALIATSGVFPPLSPISVHFCLSVAMLVAVLIAMGQSSPIAPNLLSRTPAQRPVEHCSPQA